MLERAINIILVDDELHAIQLLESYFSKYFLKDVNILGSFTDATEALSFISDCEQLDLVVFDINMPEINGVELLEAFPNRTFEAIFITAHVDFSLDAFKNKALDYLLKPIDRLEFIQSMKTTIKRVRKLKFDASTVYESAAVDRFSIMHKGRNLFILYSELIYLKAEGSYTKLITKGGDYLISKNLKNTLYELDHSCLLKLSRSFVINRDHIVSFSKKGDGSIILSNQHEVGISRMLKKEVLSSLGKN